MLSSTRHYGKCTINHHFLLLLSIFSNNQKTPFVYDTVHRGNLRGKKTALDFTDPCCFFIILLTIDIKVPSTVGFYYHM